MSVPRNTIQIGDRVSIVTKADQNSGRRTQGVVAAILTRSATHPHGIKVRLESGAVGRVKAVVPGNHADLPAPVSGSNQD